MKDYKITWSRDDYGYVIITANNKEEAQELFEIGEFKDEDLNVKGGNMIIENIKELQPPCTN